MGGIPICGESDAENVNGARIFWMAAFLLAQTRWARSLPTNQNHPSTEPDASCGWKTLVGIDTWHRVTAPFMDHPKTGVKIMDWEVCSPGYAAVWAQENTRESLGDAMVIIHRSSGKSGLTRWPHWIRHFPYLAKKATMAGHTH